MMVLQYKSFGAFAAPVIVFFHASLTHWSWYQASIDELAKNYRVIVPLIAGFNPDDKSNFISVEQTVKEATEYLLEQGLSEICGAYGASFGGSMVLRMLAEKKIKIQKAIVDGGITPYQLPHSLTRLVLLRDYWGVRLLRGNMLFLKLAFPEERWLTDGENKESYYHEMKIFMDTLSLKTIRNTFDSANNFSMPKKPIATGTKITYWYGSREQKARRWDISYMQRMFPHTDFCEFPDMEHVELVLMKPTFFGQRAVRFFS